MSNTITAEAAETYAFKQLSQENYAYAVICAPDADVPEADRVSYWLRAALGAPQPTR